MKLKMKVSKRAKKLGTETAFEVSKEVEKLNLEGKDIITFHIGQPDFKTPLNICQAAIRAIQEGKHGYTPSPGIVSLRQAAADYFSRTRKISVSPDSIVIDSGAKPFINHVLNTVINYGRKEEVIFTVPGYPIYDSLIRDNGAIPMPITLHEDKNFGFDLEEFRQKVNKKTRLIFLNSPHNPTGAVFPPELLQKMAEIIVQYKNLWVYADEPYSNLAFDGEFKSIASFPGMPERTIIVDCVSKRYAMPGWRIGFASNPQLAGHLARRVTNTTSCANHLAQYAAVEALTGPQEEAEKMAQEFKKRRDFLVQELNKLPGVKCLLPGGAFYAWPNVEDLCQRLGLADADELRKKLLYEAGVSVLSDKHFTPEGVNYEGQHLRFAFTVSIDKIEKGLKRIGEWIDRQEKCGLL